MGGYENTNLTNDDITDIITNELGYQLISDDSTVVNQGIYVQVSDDSIGCENEIDIDSQIIYTSNSEDYSSQSLYQTAVSNITNEIISQIGQDISGFGNDDEEVNLSTLIQSTIETNMTAENIQDVNKSSSAQNIVAQGCVGSLDSSNNFTGTYDQTISFYNQLYASNEAVQQTSAILSNMISSDVDQSESGVLGGLIKLIVMIIVLIIVVVIALVIVVGGGYLLVTMMGSK